MTKKIIANKRLHLFYSGSVQGVGFRYTAERVALSLDLSGWVGNLPDGRVEVLVCGEKTDVETLLTWLWQGPELAKVTDVTWAKVEWREFDRFAIL